jgi:hypothetical protein
VLTQEQAKLIAMAILLRCEPQGACLVWTGARTAAGYGQIQRRKIAAAPLYVHHVMWIARHGDIPDGKHVLHKCDNPPCFREGHLFLGDHQANMDDKMAKGRHRHGHLYGDEHPARKNPVFLKRGEQHPMVKLTWAQVEEIRLRPLESATVLGKEFGVTRSAIDAIRKGRTWAKKISS